MPALIPDGLNRLFYFGIFTYKYHFVIVDFMTEESDHLFLYCTLRGRTTKSCRSQSLTIWGCDGMSSNLCLSNSLNGQ